MELNLTPNDPGRAKKYFLNKMTFTTGPAEVKSLLDKSSRIILIDVRAARDFSEGHIPGALNLPQTEWKTLKGLKKGEQHILYCYSHVCHLAAKAALFFAEQGFPVMEMDGGIEAWKHHNYPLETSVEERRTA